MDIHIIIKLLNSKRAKKWHANIRIALFEIRPLKHKNDTRIMPKTKS